MPFTALANDSTRSASALEASDPRLQTERREYPRVAEHARCRKHACINQDEQRAGSVARGPRNRASANRVVKDHDQNTPMLARRHCQYECVVGRE
jgi:hypothetical protein